MTRRTGRVVRRMNICVVFKVHGSYTLLGFQKAVQLHALAAWTLLLLWAFTILSSPTSRP